MNTIILNENDYQLIVDLIGKIEKTSCKEIGILKDDVIINGYPYNTNQPVIFERHRIEELQRQSASPETDEYLSKSRIFYTNPFSKFVCIGSIESSIIIPIKDIILKKIKSP